MGYPLIVTGMHRSGTSLVSSFCHNAGISMGENLVGPSRGNPRGHYEDAGIVEFHMEIMRRAIESGNRHGLPEVTEADRERAKALLRTREEKGPWGWKDPRTCLFLDMWEDIATTATFLFVVRHPWEVVVSMRKRDDDRTWWWKSDTMKLRNWMRHTGQCLRFARRYPMRSEVTILRDIIGNPDEFLRRVGRAVETDLGNASFTEVFDPALLTRSVKPFAVAPLPVDAVRSLRMYHAARNLSRGERVQSD